MNFREILNAPSLETCIRTPVESHMRSLVLYVSLKFGFTAAAASRVACAHNLKQQRKKLDGSCEISVWLRPSAWANQDAKDRTAEVEQTGREEERAQQPLKHHSGQVEL